MVKRCEEKSVEGVRVKRGTKPNNLVDEALLSHISPIKLILYPFASLLHQSNRNLGNSNFLFFIFFNLTSLHVYIVAVYDFFLKYM